MLGVDPAHGAARLARTRRHRAAGVARRAGADRARVHRDVTRATTARRAPVDETLELVGLDRAQADDGAATLSGGAAAAARRRPGAGRRPGADVPRRADHRLRPRRAARRVGRSSTGLRELGKTIVLTTHYMEEAERLADRIVVIARRRHRRRGDAGDARRPRPRRGRRSRFTLPAGAGAAGAARGSRRRGPRPRGAASRAVADGRPPRALRLGARARASSSSDLEVRRPTLEDVYLDLTNPTAGSVS